MSCLDVMYNLGYGTHCSSSETSAAASTAYCHRQQQQQRISFQGKMAHRVEAPAQSAQGKLTEPAGEREQGVEEVKGGAGDVAVEKEPQPAEVEYLSSRCVLLTYVRGDVGDVVDEHFSRALRQAGALPGHTYSGQTLEGGLHTGGGILSSGQCADFPSSLWSSGYPSQSGPCLSIRPDLSPSAIFHLVEHGSWAGHGLPAPPPPSDRWPYGLGAQGGCSYAHVREDDPRVHAHHRTFGSTLDPLLPGVCPPGSPATHGGIGKTAVGTSSGSALNWHIVHQPTN